MEMSPRIVWRVDPPPPSLQSTVCVWPPPGTHARLFQKVRQEMLLSTELAQCSVNFQCRKAVQVILFVTKATVVPRGRSRIESLTDLFSLCFVNIRSGGEPEHPVHKQKNEYLLQKCTVQ